MRVRDGRVVQEGSAPDGRWRMVPIVHVLVFPTVSAQGLSPANAPFARIDRSTLLELYGREISLMIVARTRTARLEDAHPFMFMYRVYTLAPFSIFVDKTSVYTTTNPYI